MRPTTVSSTTTTGPACVCRPVAIRRALTASVGPAREALTKTVADLISGGLFVGDEDPGYQVVESIDFSDSTTAVVVSCWWDTGVLYGPPAQPGGPPLIINNLQVTSRFGSTMKLAGGRWLVSEEQRISRVEGANECPPESRSPSRSRSPGLRRPRPPPLPRQVEDGEGTETTPSVAGA